MAHKYNCSYSTHNSENTPGACFLKKRKFRRIYRPHIKKSLWPAGCLAAGLSLYVRLPNTLNKTGLSVADAAKLSALHKRKGGRSPSPG
jgi:hypothetical protein